MVAQQIEANAAAPYQARKALSVALQGLVRVTAVDSAGSECADQSNGFFAITSQTGVGDAPFTRRLALMPNSPNPFRGGTAMSFSLPEPSRTEIVVYSVAGRKIATVCDRELSAGDHSVAWDGRDESGRPVAAGIYFYRLRAGTDVLTKKMVLIK